MIEAEKEELNQYKEDKRQMAFIPMLAATKGNLQNRLTMFINTRMIITVDNTKNLSSYDFIEKLSIELWDGDNIYLIDEPKRTDIAEYFYITAYLIQFETEFEMQGLTTLLTNSSTYNFENTLESFKTIGSTKLANCLQDILDTLNKHGMTPAKMRDHFLKGTEELPEYSIITTGQFFKEDDLLDDLHIHENELNEIYSEIRTDLEKYLIKIRGI